jgi:hypothetical protein
VFATIVRTIKFVLGSLINFAGQFFTGKPLRDRTMEVGTTPEVKRTFDFSKECEAADAFSKALEAIGPERYRNMLSLGTERIEFEIGDSGQMTANVKCGNGTALASKARLDGRDLSVDSIRRAHIFDRGNGADSGLYILNVEGSRGILAALGNTQAALDMNRNSSILSMVIGGRELCKKNADGSYNENFWLEVTEALQDFVEEKCAGKSGDEKEKFMLHVLQAICKAYAGQADTTIATHVLAGLSNLGTAENETYTNLLPTRPQLSVKIEINDAEVRCNSSFGAQVALFRSDKMDELAPLPFITEESILTSAPFDNPHNREVSSMSRIAVYHANDGATGASGKASLEKGDLIKEIRPALETVDEDSILNITQASAKSNENVNAWSTRHYQ